MSSEVTKADLDRLFNEPQYKPCKFECRQCGAFVRYKDLECTECENMLMWCSPSIVQRANKVSFTIMV